jgi:hypothetical protein
LSCYDDADIDAWRAGVRQRTNLDRVPFTLVAHLDAEPVGCLSVTDDDETSASPIVGSGSPACSSSVAPGTSAWVELVHVHGVATGR